MEEKVKMMIMDDHKIGGMGYRILAKKYGMSRTQIHRIVMSKAGKKGARPRPVTQPLKEEVPLPDNIIELKEALRQARLKIELQDLMLDIASKELGVDIRKKSGTRQSK